MVLAEPLPSPTNSPTDTAPYTVTVAAVDAGDGHGAPLMVDASGPSPNSIPSRAQAIGRAMEVTATVDIAALPEEVFAYLSDMENNPKWQSGMVSARWTSDGPIGVGSTYDQVATFLRRKIESTFEVEAYEPGRMIRASSTAGSFPITFARMVEPIDSGTKVTAIITGDASGFFKIAEPILRLIVQRSIDGDYRNLREVFTPRNAD